MEITKEEAETIIKLAQKLIIALEKNDNLIIRNTEDNLDNDIPELGDTFSCFYGYNITSAVYDLQNIKIWWSLEMGTHL